MKVTELWKSKGLYFEVFEVLTICTGTSKNDSLETWSLSIKLVRVQVVCVLDYRGLKFSEHSPHKKKRGHTEESNEKGNKTHNYAATNEIKSEDIRNWKTP